MVECINRESTSLRIHRCITFFSRCITDSVAHISLKMHRIRAYRYRIKSFPQTKLSTKRNFTLIDRGRLDFTGNGRSDHTPTRDGRLRYLLNKDVWVGYLVDRDRQLRLLQICILHRTAWVSIKFGQSQQLRHLDG